MSSLPYYYTSTTSLPAQCCKQCRIVGARGDAWEKRLDVPRVVKASDPNDAASTNKATTELRAAWEIERKKFSRKNRDLEAITELRAAWEGEREKLYLLVQML